MLSEQRAEEYLQSDRIIISLHICRKFNEATIRSLALMNSQAGRTVIQWPLQSSKVRIGRSSMSVSDN